jgi:signal transduction histidine kinase
LSLNIEAERKAINNINAIPVLLEVICSTTGMGFAAVARVTRDRWIAYAVLDKINFGLKAGGELKVETTLCNEVNQFQKAIVINNFSLDEHYADHHTPALYGLQSYISIPIILKDGSFFGTLCAIHPEPSDVNNPKIIGMFNLYAELISFHLHEQQKLEEVEARLAEEKQIAIVREQFIAILGHDLRNPVGAVKNIGQLLQRESIDLTNAKRFGGMLLNSTQRMLGLIDNLMDFARSRLNAGIDLHRTDVFLDQPLRHVINELQIIWPERHIVADLAITALAHVDQNRITQLFSNLLSNALTHGIADKPVFVNAAIHGTALLLSVKNSGDDIPESILNHLFEPFSRNRSDKNRAGLGLGLYISSEIVKAHGGKLQAFSADSEIEFQVTIPFFSNNINIEAPQ